MSDPKIAELIVMKGKATMLCPVTQEDCTSVDCIGPKSCRALEEQPQARLQRALEKMLLHFHDGVVPIIYRGKPGAFDCATMAIAEARAALRETYTKERA